MPEDGTRLADFIHKRLFDSYTTWSARQFVTWTLAEELPRLRRSIDAGRPVVLGLVVGDQAARWPEEGRPTSGTASASSPTSASTWSPERPGPEAGDGPWTVEFTIEVTPLDS